MELFQDLLEQGMRDCVFLNAQRVDDGYGGVKTEWSEGAKFKAGLSLDSSMQARIGEKLGVTSLYTVTTSKSIALEYHNVFKCLETTLDDKTKLPELILRVTSKSDKLTPATSNLDMRQCSAEEWELTR